MSLAQSLSTLLVALPLFFSACISPERPPGDFVETTDFHKLQSFGAGSINLSGMDWDESTAANLRASTKSALNAALAEQGFKYSDDKADFVVRANWKKALRAEIKARSILDTVPEMQERSEHFVRPRVMCSLTVELYDPKRDLVFWRSNLPNCLEALRLNEKRVAAVIQTAMTGFPERIEIDPNLLSIE